MAGHTPAQHREAAGLRLRLGSTGPAGVYEIDCRTELLQVCGFSANGTRTRVLTTAKIGLLRVSLRAAIMCP